MSKEQRVVERRKSKRFNTSSGVFAVNSHFGLIIDISMGGLAFRYVDRGAWKDISIETGSLFGEDDLWIDNIPIKHVSECGLDNGVACKSTLVKKRSVAFGNLTPQQKKLLENFIWVNTQSAIEATHAI